MTEIQYADDAQVLNACEDGIVGWEVAEQVELGTETPTDQAKRLRGIIYLMVVKGQARSQAEKDYDALLVKQKENEKRTIQTLEERVIQLHEKGQLTNAELEEFRDGDRLVKFKIQALSGGADVKEATRFAKLAKKNADAWQDLDAPDPPSKETDKVRRMALRYAGMTDEEVTLLFGIEENSGQNVPEWLKMRKIGMPLVMAQRFQDLIDRYNELTREEDIERKSYINLRSVLERAQSNLATRLAVQDFGIERIFEYILLNTGGDILHNQEAAMSRGVPITNANVELAQNLIDNIHSQAEPVPYAKKDRIRELRQSLQNEPALRQFVDGYRDTLMQAIDTGYFR
jgi:hypothetical protein